MEYQQLQVSIRIRPVLQSEVGKEEVVSAQGQTLTISDSTHLSQYNFDHIYDQQSDQEQIFEQIQPLISQVISGYNSTILAYGQTGSGKTFTMFGSNWEMNSYQRSSQRHTLNNQQTHGIIPRSVSALFNQLQQSQYTILTSFIQIYNEQIYDLLQDPAISAPLQIREDPASGLFIEGISEYVVQSDVDCFALIKSGDRNRIVRQTKLNVKSSRSHSIFQIFVESDNVDDNNRLKRAKLNLCDLAGSEKFDKTGEMGAQHIRELNKINLSLTTLGKVISGLASGKRSHIPYRESKLTRLLQDSLGGNTLTYFIATLAPVRDFIEETISTLNFASRAKNIQIRVTKNEISATDNQLVSKLQREIQYLKEILHIKNRGGDSVSQLQNKLLSLQEENQKLRQINQQLTAKEVLKLKQENKRLRLQLQQMTDSDSSNGFKHQQQQNYKTDSSNKSRESQKSYDSIKQYSQANKKLEIRIRGKNQNFKTVRGFIHKSLQEQKSDRNNQLNEQRRLERHRTLENLRVQRNIQIHSALKKQELAMRSQLQLQQNPQFREVIPEKKIKIKRKSQSNTRSRRDNPGIKDELDMLKWHRRNLPSLPPPLFPSKVTIL